MSRLIAVTESTTIRVSADARDELRELARQSGRTMTDELKALVRAERQRRMGDALSAPMGQDDDLWIELASAEVARETG